MVRDEPEGFEWDAAKAQANVAKHGVPFDAASDVFDDPDRVQVVDARRDYGEERRIVIGLVDGVHLSVTYTMRQPVIARIISIRIASRKERLLYDHHPKDAV